MEINTKETVFCNMRNGCAHGEKMLKKIEVDTSEPVPRAARENRVYEPFQARGIR